MGTRVKLCMIALALVAYSCGTSKSATAAADPYAGDWNVVTSTPDGELESTMKITKNDDATYTGVVSSDQGMISMEELTIENSELTSSLTVQGMQFELKGNFTDESFKGEFAGMGTSFPVAGSKSTE